MKFISWNVLGLPNVKEVQLKPTQQSLGSIPKSCTWEELLENPATAQNGLNDNYLVMITVICSQNLPGTTAL